MVQTVPQQPGAVKSLLFLVCAARMSAFAKQRIRSAWHRNHQNKR
jgi:hypothetical protein